MKLKILNKNNIIIVIFVILLLLFLINWIFVIYKKKEGFQWSQNTINNFLNYQKLYNPNMVYDIQNLQTQASEDEVNYLIENNRWPWNDNVKAIYMEQIKKNVVLKIDPLDAMMRAQKIYNETIMKEMLSWDTKEGKFLLRGIKRKDDDQYNEENTYGYNSGLITPYTTSIICGKNKYDKNVLQKVTYNGYDGITGARQKKIVDIKNYNIPNEVPGFQFINGPCNPCIGINNPPDYSCPFTIETKDNRVPSNIWEYLWRDIFFMT